MCRDIMLALGQKHPGNAMGRRRLFVPRSRPVVWAANDPAPQQEPFGKPGQLTTEELFTRCNKMVDAGMSRDAAEACLVNTEWVASGPVRIVADEVKQLDVKVNVLIALVVIVLTFVDIDKLPNTLIGALIRKFL